MNKENRIGEEAKTMYLSILSQIKPRTCYTASSLLVDTVCIPRTSTVGGKLSTKEPFVT